jgi:hypothetical protein
MLSSQSTPDGRSPRLIADKLRVALSSPIRIRILMALEGECATLTDLTERISPDVSLKDIKYHVEILEAGGCLSVESVSREKGTAQDIYRAKPDVFLDPLYLDRATASEEQESLGLHWMEVFVDPVGGAQVLEILWSTRLQFLMAEEQSRARLRFSEDEELVPMVVGAVGFGLKNREVNS